MGTVTNIARFVGDGLTNLISRLGTDRDKATHSVYGEVVLDDLQIFNAYRGAWLPKKIVDIPALDSCRKWRDWQAKADQIELIEAEEKRLNVRGKVLEARTKARLWGGAAILIGTGEEDQALPLEVDSLGSAGIQYLTVFTRKELSAGEIEYDPASELYGKPRTFRLNAKNGQMVDIHASRLVIFHGSPVPDDEYALHRGWGDSVLTSTLNAVKNADSTAGNIASLVFEAKIDVIRAPNFMASLSDPEYENRWIRRFSLANMGKGINGTLVLDKEEEYDSKSANFATLPDVLDRFLTIVAGAADIPATRLLGQSPAGMNSTGESDLRNYYDRISAMQEIEMTPAMQRMDEAIIRSALGSRPPEVHYIWSSLWQISDKERSEIGKASAETIKVLNETALFPTEALAKSAANMLVENSIMPGLEQAIDDAGGLPDYEMEAEAEREWERLRLEAEKAKDPQQRAMDAVARWRSGMPPRSQDDVEAIYAYYRGETRDAAPRTLYIRRDVLNAAEIARWAKGQGFATVQEGLHVTIMHTRTPLDWIKVGQAWEGDERTGQLIVPPGGPRLMERFGDAVVLQFSHSRLAWRHQDIRDMGAEVDHPEYQPHVTITWNAPDIDLGKVEPYRGKIVLGPEVFEEVDEDWRATVEEA